LFEFHFFGFPDGKGCARDPARAFVYFTKGAVAGDLISMKNLGIVYENGRAGVVDKSMDTAMEWYGRGAHSGHQARVR
jgi:TPR repeat protein